MIKSDVDRLLDGYKHYCEMMGIYRCDTDQLKYYTSLAEKFRKEIKHELERRGKKGD